MNQTDVTGKTKFKDTQAEAYATTATAKAARSRRAFAGRDRPLRGATCCSRGAHRQDSPPRVAEAKPASAWATWRGLGIAPRR